MRDAIGIREIVGACPVVLPGRSVPLLFPASGEWTPLPDWAYFFIDLGRFLEIQQIRKKRVVIGAAIPARTYAASLTATGAVVAYLRDRLKSDIESHFERLCGLPMGTGVMLIRHDGNGDLIQYPGVLAGFHEQPAAPSDTPSKSLKFIKVLVSRPVTNQNRSGGLVFMVGAKCADSIRVLDQDEAIDVRELPEINSGRHIKPESPFTQIILGGEAGHYRVRSKVECLIVGNHRILNHEINEFPLGTYGGQGEILEGTPGELLHVRKFSRLRHQFHSDIYPAKSKHVPKISRIGNPHVVIFDGAAGYMKWRDTFQRSHLLVILDQTEPQFLEATQRLNYEYSCRVGNDSIPADFPPPPSGVELTFFRELIV